MLSHAGALPFAPTLQRRTVPSLHPYATVERPSAAMSSMPEPPHWPLGHVPISTRMPTLLVPELQAHLQRPHRYPLAPEQAAAGLLDPGDLSALSRLFVAADCEGGGGPYAYQLSVVLAAA